MAAVTVLACLVQSFTGAAPTDAELAEAQQWVAAKFEGVAPAKEARPHVEVIENHDPVQANARRGKPLRLGDREYTRGLYCHAESHVVVHLPGPGKHFEAAVGVDSNEQTSSGRGSVVFAVRVAERETWRSELLREGMPAVSVNVDLEGARCFELRVEDGGDGISCDQADWAEARVTLEDGRVVWVGDLPIDAHTKASYDLEPFFSFTYGGRHSGEFLSKWPSERTSEALDTRRTGHTLTYRDPDTGLTVRCVGVAYRDSPTVEWTLYFRNDGAKDTPVLSDILAVDTRFERAAAGEFVLNRHKGDNCTADSYEPIRETLPPEKDLRIANTGGRPTQIAFPYYNLAFGDEEGPGAEGLIFVVSWAGQWMSQFTRDAAYGVRLRAGQALTHFALRPGEEVRGPMIVLQFWKGGRLHAQNVWRAWMIAHNLPRPGGRPPVLPLLAACSSHQYGEMIHADTKSQIFFLDKYLERDIRIDYWWMDAGWYYNKTGWPNTGTWEIDQDRFPGGFRPITDHAHAKGVNIIVWFEPERVTAGTWLAENHPEWIHGGKSGGLLDLGNPAARQWLTDHVDGLLTREGIDLYRQDFNVDPLDYWRRADRPDRQGITEIRHVEGYFAYWDELRRRHPDMLIDSCASGGRRNDLETLRRAVPLLRSDYIMEPTGNQCHTWALSFWFPFYGTGTSKTNPYLVRSVLCPNFIACWDQRDPNLDYPTLARIIAQWRAFGPNYFGDYYPLTPYTLANDQWIAWQFDRPEEGGGMVQVFRREESVYESARLPLNAMRTVDRYRVTNVDAPEAFVEYTGAELQEHGLPVTIPDRPGTAFFVYERIPQ
ncbi:MAG TPA: NPCBM/NEW2 domain-containing protein [Candidatus Hydrogenedentes bacterium]|nr:NPCBM/NEW2 domain-containing protein [Candidatus Hydrogenedentota bacterium]